MADFKTPGLGIGLEFERNDIYDGNNFSEGSPDPQRDDEVFFLKNYLFFGTTLKSGQVETVPTGPVATAL